MLAHPAVHPVCLARPPLRGLFSFIVIHQGDLRLGHVRLCMTANILTLLDTDEGGHQGGNTYLCFSNPD